MEPHCEGSSSKPRSFSRLVTYKHASKVLPLCSTVRLKLLVLGVGSPIDIVLKESLGFRLHSFLGLGPVSVYFARVTLHYDPSRTTSRFNFSRTHPSLLARDVLHELNTYLSQPLSIAIPAPSIFLPHRGVETCLRSTRF